MQVIFKKDWTLLNAESGSSALRNVPWPAGNYRLNRIDHPTRQNGRCWLVIEGTIIGGPETIWLQWSRSNECELSLNEEEASC